MVEFTASAEGWAEGRGPAELAGSSSKMGSDVTHCSLGAAVESQPRPAETLLSEHLTWITWILFLLFSSKGLSSGDIGKAAKQELLKIFSSMKAMRKLIFAS